MSAALELERRDDLAWLWLDRPDSGVNTLDRATMERLDELLAEVERDPRVRAAVLISRKPRGFIAGADIRAFERFDEPAEVEAAVREGQRIVGRLAALPKPLVAAVHGACMGGGLELALACRYRIASDHSATRFALPEVKLGLLPAFGGCGRLPRLVGLQRGLELILSGRSVYARAARRLGLVDATVHPPGLERAAEKAARALADGSLTPPARGAPPLRRVLERTPLQRLVYGRAADEVQARTHGNLPAPGRIIEVVRTAAERGQQAGERAEAAAFAELLFTPESRALVALFFAKNAAEKAPPPSAGAREVRTIGVLGAGLMGAGIAQVSVRNGYAVVLKDTTLELAAAGRGRVHQGLSARLGKGLSAFERDRLLARVTPADDYRPFGRTVAPVDLTIEAVPEALDLKRRMLAEVEAHTGDDHVFASNTSSLRIADIAAGARRPEAVVGMHYFAPVPKMPLLEVVASERTGEWAVATAVAVGLQQGKTVITVADSPGFYVNRILVPYLDEALKLLAEGAAVDEVDAAMKRFGFPLGPLLVADNSGLDVGVEVMNSVRDLFADRGRELARGGAEALAAGLRGRKAGAGFYRYEGGERKGPNPDAYRYFGGDGRERRTVPRSEIQERCAMALVNEAVACLQEGVIRRPLDGDVGAVFGIGFPPFLGGPFHWLDRLGAGEAVARLERLAERHGSRFAPVAALRERAERGERFHPARAR